MKKTSQKIHDIIIIDDLPPEDIAMLQALYSRDPRSVKTQLKKVKDAGPGKFMSKFYVGYGHKSIGDCGTTTLFAENVSMLCAKAIQDWLLYNGQESSTRYLDFSKMAIADPAGTKKSAEIMREIMSLYNESLDVLTEHLKEKYPIAKGEKEDIYEKAIKARAFDISRCFLPSGMTTMVAWHTNLRQAADHIKCMRHHPLKEVREVAEDMSITLAQKYPNSFGHKRYPEEEAYVQMTQNNVAYSKPFRTKKLVEYTSYLKKDVVKKYMKELSKRPMKAELPFQIRAAGDIIFRFHLDFGSYRDLQRQRSMIAHQPLLTTKLGFHSWYLEQLPQDFRKKAKAILKEIEKKIKALSLSDEEKQYYIPMGYQVAIEMTATLPAAVYIAELRSGKMVHPTLRPVAQELGKVLKKLIPSIAIHCDTGGDDFSIKRGDQDITEKK